MEPTSTLVILTSLAGIAVNVGRKLANVEDTTSFGAGADVFYNTAINLLSGFGQSALQNRPDSPWTVLKNGDFERVTREALRSAIVVAEPPADFTCPQRWRWRRAAGRLGKAAAAVWPEFNTGRYADLAAQRDLPARVTAVLRDSGHRSAEEASWKTLLASVCGRRNLANPPGLAAAAAASLHRDLPNLILHGVRRDRIADSGLVHVWLDRIDLKLDRIKEAVDKVPAAVVELLEEKNLLAGGSPRMLHALPPVSRIFIGREVEEEELLALLRDGDAAGAAISGSLQGMGGVGKTALAVVLAHRLSERYPGAQLYRDLRGADERRPLSPAEVMRDFIVALHPRVGQLPEDLEALGGIYRSVLSEAGRVLLLLDNAADAEQVRPLQPPPGCLLLITSRQRFTLPGLVVRDLDCLAPEKAAALLLRLAPPVGDHADEGAQLCGGLPLAIEVFAGAINNESLTPVAELLDRLRPGAASLSKVDAAFAVSEGLLPDVTRTAWHLLSIFTASFDVSAAAAIWEREPTAARAVLQALVNANLVEFNKESARFRLHDLARQFCERRLSEVQREEASLQHAMHYIAVGDNADQIYLQGGAHVVEGLELFDRERAHLEAAFTWLEPREDIPSATLLYVLVNATCYVSDLRFHSRQRIAWLEAQCRAGRLVGDRDAEGTALGNLGLAHAGIGDFRKAIEFHEQGLVISREIGGRQGEGRALGNLGSAHLALGDARKAIEFHEQALVVAREIGDRRGEGQDLGNLGNDHWALGDARKASEFYEQALAVAREIGDRRVEGSLLGNLGLAHAALGNARQAIEFHEQNCDIAREIGDRRGEGTASFNLALQYWPRGERVRALELVEAAWEILTAIEDPLAGRAGAVLQEWRGATGDA